MNIIANNQHYNFFKLIRIGIDLVGYKLDKFLVPNSKEMKLALFGKKGFGKYRSALGGFILFTLEKYVLDWKKRQKQLEKVYAPIRIIKAPPKTYTGWKSLRDDLQPNWKPISKEGEIIKLLPNDSMTPKERVLRIIQGKTPDRVAFGPNWDYAISYLGGSNIWEFAYDGIATGVAGLNTWIRTGGTDFLPQSFGVGAYAVPFPDIHSRYFYKWSLPSDALFPQFIEECLLTYQDLYDYGFTFQMQEITKRLMRDTLVMLREVYYMGKTFGYYFKPIKDQFLPYSAGMISAFDWLPMSRGLIPFSKDVRNHKEDIIEAFQFLNKPFIDFMINIAKTMKAPTVLVGCSRGSNSWMSPNDFQETHWPMLKYTFDQILDAGMIPMCHFDNDWTENMIFLSENLPKRSCIFHLDQVDLVKVHNLIGDHFCLMGGLGPDLLTFGTPYQVENACLRYIDALKDDGLILASGCEIPIDIPIQNMMAYKRAILKKGYF